MESPLILDGGEMPGGAMREARCGPSRRAARSGCATPRWTRCSSGTVRAGSRAAASSRAAGDSDRVRLWRGVLELVAASLAGIVRDDVLWRGFGVLDDEDLRAWLGRHGASEETLARSPVLRGLYDLTFAYRGGDKRRPSLAAGKGLQSLLMMINYEGSFMWRMRAGMGDVVFAPLYLALRRRGVRFQFFSRVTRLRLMPGRPVVDAIELVREARVAAGADRYDPIERIGDWWCWPAAPDSGQLSDRAAATATGRRGTISTRSCSRSRWGRWRRSAVSWPRPIRGSSRCSTARDGAHEGLPGVADRVDRRAPRDRRREGSTPRDRVRGAV